MLARQQGRRETVERSKIAGDAPKLRAKVPSGASRLPLTKHDPLGSLLPGTRGSPPRSSPSTGETLVSSEPHRSALKTRLDILEAVRDEGPSNRFKIMTAANLSAERNVKYLGELVSRGLLMEDRDTVPKSYALTAKGLDFLNRVKEAEALVAAFGLAL